MSLLTINETEFVKEFNRGPFLIQHQLAGHPLFELSRLVELSRRVKEEDVEYNAGDLPIHQDPYSTPRTGLSVEETILRIRDQKSWLVLKHVEKDVEYRALLDECLNEIQKYSEPIYPGMTRREGFIFISSPGAVTPYHMDPEHNFLLQIQGSKTIRQWDALDESVLTENDKESYFAGGHRNLTYREEFAKKAKVIELPTGKGLHFPVAAPHWVQNGPEVSVSFSVTFRSKKSIQQMSLYRFNAWLRKRGIAPAAVGKNPILDATKYQAYRLISRTLGA